MTGHAPPYLAHWRMSGQTVGDEAAFVRAFADFPAEINRFTDPAGEDARKIHETRLLRAARLVAISCRKSRLN